jgi:hypothetical protein
MSDIFGGVAPGTVVSIPAANAGLDFTANHAGTISALQWWFATGGGGSLALTLYDAQTAAVLASVGPMSTAGFVANAWNVVPLGAPVALTAGKVYTAAGWTNGANTGLTANGLANHVFATDLTGLKRTGRFDLGGAPAFPTTASSNGTDQWPVDVVFAQTPTCPECPPCPPTEGFLINLTSPGFINVVTGVGGCIIEALDQTPAGAPCRQCLLLPTQAIPWDNCGPCVATSECTHPGQVALAIREVYGSGQFPQPMTASLRKCNHRYEVVRAVVTVTRCVPAMDQDGAPPDCAAELAAAVILENDRTAVRQAIACCLAYQNGLTPWWVSEWAIGGSVTVGELGGCAGVETEFFVGVQSCLCPN